MTAISTSPTDVGNGQPAQNELTFREIVDGISALVACLTPDGAVEFANRQVLDYFGKTLDELKEWASTDAVHPDDLPRVIQVFTRSLETGQPYDVELRQRRADGVYRWFHVQGLPVRGAEGTIRRWCILQTDIDDQRKAEEALHERERELRQLIETIPAHVARMTANGALEYVNRRVLDFVGVELEQIGIHITHPDDQYPRMMKWRRALKTGEPWEHTLRVRRADGEYRWFYQRNEPLLDEDGRVVCWYSVGFDITDSREMEEMLRSTRRKLSAAMQIATVAELSASIAHEINQPLASVVTNAHAAKTWLSHDPPNLERAQATLERIIRDGHSAAEVVRRIRALFKEAAPVKAPLDINQIVDEVLRVLSDELRDNSIIVETELEADPPVTEADHVQIQQTLINLVHNAIEAMAGEKNGAKTLLLSSRRQGDELLVQVRDHGLGIDDPTLMFEPFFTTKESGMGMGLSICRSIVEAHGGRVWAAANDDAGMTLSFTLPLTLDARSPEMS
jgi:PAS domain S-box-containing protein